AALRLADLRALQQLFPRRLSAVVPVPVLAVHRAELPVPEGPTGLAQGEIGVAGRPLVVQQARQQQRLVAAAVLVTDVVSGIARPSLRTSFPLGAGTGCDCFAGSPFRTRWPD